MTAHASKIAPPLFTVAVDTREQAPLDFSPWVARGDIAGVARAALRTGDYSIVGYEDRIAIERKSLPDLLACVGRERERFERELERLAALDFAAVVVEASLEEVLAGDPHSSVPGRAAAGSLSAWEIRYRIPCATAGSRSLAAAKVAHWLRKWFLYNVARPQCMRGRSKI